VIKYIACLLFVFNSFALEIGSQNKVDKNLQKNVNVDIGSKVIIQQYFQKNKLSQGDFTFRCKKRKKQAICKLIEAKMIK